MNTYEIISTIGKGETKMNHDKYSSGNASDIWRVFYSEIEKAPCHKCDFRYSCAANHKGCADLAHYLKTGEVVERFRRPTREKFRAIFGTN